MGYPVSAIKNMQPIPTTPVNPSVPATPANPVPSKVGGTGSDNTNLQQPAQLPDFSSMNPTQLKTGALQYITTMQAAGKSPQTSMQYLNSLGLQFNEDGSVAYQEPGSEDQSQPQGFFSREAQSIENIPSQLSSDVKNLVTDRSQEGAPDATSPVNDTGEPIPGQDTANPNPSQLKNDLSQTQKINAQVNDQQVSKDVNFAKDVTAVPADIISGVLGPVFGMLPSIDPITNKVGTLNQIYSSPDMQQNSKDLQSSWSSLTKNHPVFGRTVEDTVGLANNLLQTYAGGDLAISNVADKADFFKGALDGTSGKNAVIDESTPKSFAYQKGLELGQNLKANPGSGAGFNPFKEAGNYIKTKLTPASTQSVYAAGDLNPDEATQLVKDSSAATKAHMQVGTNPSASQLIGSKLGDEAMTNLGDQSTAAGDMRSSALEKASDTKIDIGPAKQALNDGLAKLGTTLDPNVSNFGSWEESQSALNDAIDKQGSVLEDGRIGKSPFSEIEGQTSLIKNDKPGQKLLGLVNNTVARLSEGANTAPEVAGEIKNLQSAIDYDPTVRGSQAETLAKNVVKTLKDTLHEAVPDYKAAQDKFSKLIPTGDNVRSILGAKDSVTGIHEGGSAFVNELTKGDSKLAGAQEITQLPLAQKAAIAKMFDAVGDGGGKTGALNAMRIGRPEFAVARMIQGLAERYFRTPEALEAKLLDEIEKSKTTGKGGFNLPDITKSQPGFLKIPSSDEKVPTVKSVDPSRIESTGNDPQITRDEFNIKPNETVATRHWTVPSKLKDIQGSGLKMGDMSDGPEPWLGKGVFLSMDPEAWEPYVHDSQLSTEERLSGTKPVPLDIKLPEGKFARVTGGTFEKVNELMDKIGEKKYGEDEWMEISEDLEDPRVTETQHEALRKMGYVGQINDEKSAGSTRSDFESDDEFNRETGMEIQIFDKKYLDKVNKLNNYGKSK